MLCCHFHVACAHLPQRQSLTQLYRYFDRECNERVYFPDLLSAIRGTLSARRQNILDAVFDALDVRQHGAVDIDLILRTFDPSRHPQVLSGEKKPADLIREFGIAFDGAGATNNGAVSRAEFIEFYAGISAGVPYDDDFFVNIIERCWHVKEAIPSSLVPMVLTSGGASRSATLTPYSRTPMLDRVRHIFREKIRQKTTNTKSEVDQLRLVFKHFDLSNTGFIDYTGFRRAAERFGICLEDRTLQALFDEFANDEGRVDYLAFATSLYSEDTSSAAYHQFQRSQTLQASQRLAAEASRPGTGRSYIDSAQVLISSPVAAAAAPSNTASFGRTAGVRRTLNQKERESSVLPTVVFVYGGPGAGKATQSSRVVREFGFIHLSMTSLLQTEAANKGSAVGRQIAGALAAGQTVPPEVSVRLLTAAIQDHVNRGSLYFLVDGFPQSLAARDVCDAAFVGRAEVPFAVYLETPQSVLESRLQSRARHTGVPIDVAAVQREFNVFAKETIPVINAFGAEGRLHVVDAAATPDVVYQQMQKIIAEL